MHERGSSRDYQADMARGLGARVNWFGLFTMFIMVTAVVVWFAYEAGYEKAVKDLTMSKTWIALNNKK